MKKKSLAFGFFLFILAINRLSAQVTIRDSVLVGLNRQKTIEDTLLFSTGDALPVLLRKTDTGQSETRQMKGENVVHLESKDRLSLSKATEASVQFITLRFNVSYVDYWCNTGTYVRYYDVPGLVISAPVGATFNVLEAIDLSDGQSDYNIRYEQLSDGSFLFYNLEFVLRAEEEFELLSECYDEATNTHYTVYIIDELNSVIPDVDLPQEGDPVYSVIWPGTFSMTLEMVFPYYYEIYLPDTLSYGQTAPLFVQAKYNSTGADYYGVNPMEPLDFFLDQQGELLGNLIGPGGESGKVLNDVPYFSAAIGEVKYAANGEAPDSASMVQIFVTDSYGVSGAGATTVTPKKDSLALTLSLPEPKEIWPTLRALDGGNPDSRNKKSGIEILLKKNENPVANQNITVTVEMILPSGGHDHTNQPALALRGHIEARGATTVNGEGEVIAKTDGQGKITVTYTAPEFGGRFKIIAKATIDGKNLEAKDELTVKVPGLVELPQEVY